MNLLLSRAAPIGARSAECLRLQRVYRHGAQRVRYSSTSSSPEGQRNRSGRYLGMLAAFGASAAVAYYYPTIVRSAPEPESTQKPKAKAPKPSTKSTTPVVLEAEKNRETLNTQNQQAKQSQTQTQPGVYAWGSNTGKVIDAESNEADIKTPRRIPYFDGMLLRDLKLKPDLGAAITEKGDLVLWGSGFSHEIPGPVSALSGKDLVKISLSADRVLGLSSNGAVYSVPTKLDDLKSMGKKTTETAKTSWIPFWASSSSDDMANYRILTPPSLSRGDRVVDISSGLEHTLILTAKGRVFSAASSTSDFPSLGQMGVPGLRWETRPAGPYDQPHELLGFQGSPITQIATGDAHSVVLDKAGRVFSFGDNTFGQLGFESEPGRTNTDTPTLVPTDRLYARTTLSPTVTSIMAGGKNTFFTVEARETPGTGSQPASSRGPNPRVTADVWSCGQGLSGILGNGKWVHVTVGPSKVKALSSLSEFDDATNQLVPIRLRNLLVGRTHASAVMANVTRTSTVGKQGGIDANGGSDVLFWGGNEHYQLGNGKRSNSNTPLYIAPLDGDGAEAGSADQRLQIMPRRVVRFGEGGKGRKVSTEQRVECGDSMSAVYFAV